MGFFEDTTMYDRKTLPGNQAVHDMILALKWVQRNIAYFGGDPSHVVLAGHSSGSWGVRYLLSSPLASGLFHRAISRTDTGILHLTPAQASALGKEFMAKAGCSTLRCMQKLPLEKLFAASFESMPETNVFQATLDGIVLPDQFTNQLKAGNFNKVPIIFSKC